MKKDWPGEDFHFSGFFCCDKMRYISNKWSVVDRVKGKEEGIMESRTSSLEVLRFVAAMMVALVHFTQFVYEGSSFMRYGFVAVEFFLMLSGFFMMSEITKSQKDGKVIPS